MSNKYAILIGRDVNKEKQFLLVRHVGETLLQFPIIARSGRETHKQAIKRGLNASLGLEIATLKRIGVTGYQAKGFGYFPISIYVVDCVNRPQLSSVSETLVWMSKETIHEHIAQMSYLMYESIIPCLDEGEVWF